MFSSHAVKAGTAPFAYAEKGVRKGRLGAGDFVWSRRTNRVECALVLEPEVPLETAMEMVPLAMVAASDALGAIGPPQLALEFGWPFTLYANGAAFGHVRVAVAPQTALSEQPDWMVLGLSMALSYGRNTEPGEDIKRTALMEEGCGDLDRTMIIEAFARHMLSWIDGWESDGFSVAAQSWFGKCLDRDKFVRLKFGNILREGKLIGLDDHGGALLKNDGKVVGVSLCDAIGLGALASLDS